MLCCGASQTTEVALVIKNLPAMHETQEIQVQSLCQEGPLEEGMAAHSSIFAWEVPWTEEPGGLQSMGSQSRTRRTRLTHTHTHAHTCALKHSPESDSLQPHGL